MYKYIKKGNFFYFDVDGIARETAITRSAQIEETKRTNVWYFWENYDTSTFVFRCPKCRTLLGEEQEFYSKFLYAALSYAGMITIEDMNCPSCGCHPDKFLRIGRTPIVAFKKQFWHNDQEKTAIETVSVKVGVTKDLTKVYSFEDRDRIVFNKITKRPYRVFGKKGGKLSVRHYKGGWREENWFITQGLLPTYNEEHPEWRIKTICLESCYFSHYELLNIFIACSQYPQVSLLSAYPFFAPVCKIIVRDHPKIVATNPRGIFNDALGISLGKAQFSSFVEMNEQEALYCYNFDYIQELFQLYGGEAFKLLHLFRRRRGGVIATVSRYMRANSPTPVIAVKRTLKLFSEGRGLYYFEDIMRMVESYGLEIINIASYNKKELEWFHDILVERTKGLLPIGTKKNNEKYENNVYPKLKKRYSYEGEKYHIVVPKELKEIVEEGIHMSHCVGSYISDVAYGKLAILFLRTLEDKRVATVEVAGTRIRQVKAKKNYYPGDDVIEFIKEYCKEKGLTYNKAKENWADDLPF